MYSKAASQKLLWDFVVSEAVEDSQRWILSTMQRHGRELVGMLWRILGNEQDVCDAYQSVYLQLAHRQERCKPEHIKAYVFRTASNVAVSMLRRRLVERKTMFSVASCRDCFKSSSQQLKRLMLLGKVLFPFQAAVKMPPQAYRCALCSLEDVPLGPLR